MANTNIEPNVLSDTKTNLIKQNPKLELKENAKNKDTKKVEQVKLIEKVAYIPESGLESKLFDALSLFGMTRPITRLELEKEDITQKILDVVNQVSQMSPSGKQTGNEINNFDDGLAQLFFAKKAYIDQYYEIKDFFVICPLNYKYHISLDFDRPGKPAYHLFDLKDYSPSCGRDFCPNQSRSINIDINQIPLNSQKMPKHKFSFFEKPFRCACLCFCACCNRPEFTVKLSSNEIIGKVVELRTVCDPIIIIYDVSNIIDWRITGKCCQNGYCCRDFCMGKCSVCEFSIFNGKDVIMLHSSGKIKKRAIYGRKEKPDVDQIEIEFPPEATAKEKLCLIAAAMMIEYLYFQNGRNSKKCHG